MTEKLTQFDYLLNAMHHAGQEENPALAGYGAKRRALFEHVRKLEKDAERYRWMRDSNRIPRGADPECHIVVCSGGGEDVLWGGPMDAAIDRDMQAGAAVGAA